MCVRCPHCECDCTKCANGDDEIAATPLKVHGEVAVVNEWRDDLKGNEQRSLILEAMFSVLPPLIGLNRWEVRAKSYENCIIGVVAGKTLHEFTEYVRQLSRVLGPPERFEFETVYETRAPDFKAVWNIPGKKDYPSVILRSERPECKIDPRTTYESPKYEGTWKHPKLHPECVKALDALKDDIENEFDAKDFYDPKGPAGHAIASEYKAAMNPNPVGSDIPF